MSVFLDDIATALVNAGVGQMTNFATDWMLYKGYLAASPDRAIGLFEYPGPAPEEGLAIDYPNLQVQVRGNADDYETARSKLKAVFDTLQAQESAIGSDYILFYALQSGPLALGNDENRRPRLVLNFRCMKNRA